MVLLRCPTGCGTVRRPYARRAEPVRCANCTAWLAAAEEVEDGALVDAVLLARPGERPRAPCRRGRRRWPLIGVMLALLLVAAAGWRLHAGPARAPRPAAAAR